MKRRLHHWLHKRCLQELASTQLALILAIAERDQWRRVAQGGE